MTDARSAAMRVRTNAAADIRNVLSELSPQDAKAVLVRLFSEHLFEHCRDQTEAWAGVDDITGDIRRGTDRLFEDRGRQIGQRETLAQPYAALKREEAAIEEPSAEAGLLELGVRAKNVLTKVEGVLTGHAEYLGGPTLFLLTAPAGVTGYVPPAEWTVPSRLERIGTTRFNALPASSVQAAKTPPVL